MLPFSRQGIKDGPPDLTMYAMERKSMDMAVQDDLLPEKARSERHVRRTVANKGAAAAAAAAAAEKQGGTNNGSFHDGLLKKTDVTINERDEWFVSSTAINC